MKKIYLILPAMVLIFFSLAPVVLAQTGFVPLAGIPGLTDIQPTQEGLATFFNNLYKFAIGLAAALAVIMIIWGGLQISTQDSVSKQGEGKERITQAIIGLLLVLSPVLVFSIINPNILNLSLNLPPINLNTTPYTPAAGSPCPQGQQGTYPNCTTSCPVNSPNCATTNIFQEDFYASPPAGPAGVSCYQLATPVGGKGLYCYRDARGCQQNLRGACASGGNIAPVAHVCSNLTTATILAACMTI